MSAEIFFALVTFAFVTSVTPGPNNLMLLSSGVNFGFKRTIPHMLGIGFGFFILLLAIGFGLAALLEYMPLFYTGLKFAGGAYMLYLAWKIATSGEISTEDKSSSTPLSFMQAALFQWVNPKAWVMAVTGIATYTAGQDYNSKVVIISLIFALVNLPSVSLWAGLGTLMRKLLTDPFKLRVFNVTMGLLLVASLWPMLM